MDVFLNILFWIFAVFLILAALILFLRIKLVFKFKKQKGEDAAMSLQLKLFGGLIKKDISLDKKEDKPKEPKETQNEKDLKFFEKVKKYYGNFLDFKVVYGENSKKIRKSVYAEKILLDVSFGFGDAAKTGIATGCAWAGIYNVVAFVSKVIRIKEPKINLTPEYNEFTCNASGECIITARPVNLMITAYGIYKSYKKLKTNKI